MVNECPAGPYRSLRFLHSSCSLDVWTLYSVSLYWNSVLSGRCRKVKMHRFLFYRQCAEQSSNTIFYLSRVLENILKLESSIPCPIRNETYMLSYSLYELKTNVKSVIAALFVGRHIDLGHQCKVLSPELFDAESNIFNL